jgi:ABC-type sugar transport system permease subunit
VTKVLIESCAEFPIQVIRNGLLGSKETAFWSVFFLNRIMGIAGGGMILAGAFMRVPNELFESAELDGCGFFRETFSIAIPCVWTTLSTMMVFDLCSFFTADMAMYVYSNGTGVFGLNSMGYYLYTFSVNVASGGAIEIYHYASAVGFVITVMTVPLVLFGRWVMAKISDAVEY